MVFELIPLLTLIAVVVFGSAILTRLGRLDARARLTQSRIERVVAHLGVDSDDEPHVRAARNLLAQDKKLQAIKLWRDATGAGLADAKLAVDRLASGTD